MIELIEKQIKLLYGSTETFCTEFVYSYKGFATRKRNVANTIKRLNKFLKPLNLRVVLESTEREP